MDGYQTGDTVTNSGNDNKNKSPLILGKLKVG